MSSFSPFLVPLPTKIYQHILNAPSDSNVDPTLFAKTHPNLSLTQIDELKKTLNDIFKVNVYENISFLKTNQFQVGFNPSELGLYTLSKHGHIFSHPNLDGWIIKTLPMNEEARQLKFNTLLYRVRKAHKIHKLIEHYQLHNLVVVPQKFLYWDHYRSQFFVISQKLKIQPAKKAKSNILLDQIKQVQALALLAFESGYERLSSDDLSFTSEGRVALIHTLPRARTIRKLYSYAFIFQSLSSKPFIRAKQALIQTAKLRVVSAPESHLAILQVEKDHIYPIFMALALKTVLIAALAVVLFKLAPFFISITTLTLLQLAFLMIIPIKFYYSFVDVTDISTLWKASVTADAQKIRLFESNSRL